MDTRTGVQYSVVTRRGFPASYVTILAPGHNLVHSEFLKLLNRYDCGVLLPVVLHFYDQYVPNDLRHRCPALGTEYLPPPTQCTSPSWAAMVLL